MPFNFIFNSDSNQQKALRLSILDVSCEAEEMPTQPAFDVPAPDAHSDST